jgi:KipI family sensor histidine kinase inhibitor
MKPTFFHMSTSSLLMTVGERIDLALTHRIARFVGLLDEQELDGLRDVIPAYTTACVIYDPFVTDASELEQTLRSTWDQVGDAEAYDEPSARVVDIPVAYGGDHGADLESVANHAGLAQDEVIRRHAGTEYTVGALGFAPGFAYLIGLPPELETPRRARPRLAVPPGSIGIGGAQTGIYALPTPGGWSLIGRTPMRLFDPGQDDPFVLRMGDRVRFQPVGPEACSSLAAWPQGTGAEASGRDAGELEIIAGGMQTTVQDLGRPGYGRFGVSINGAADRASLIAANRLVGNADGAAGLEMTLVGPHIRFRRATTIALTGADLGAHVNGRPIAPGRHRVVPRDELAFAPARDASGARAYLAVAGGIDVPEVMGSRSTDLTAGFGGYRGRALTNGDVLRIGSQRSPVTRVRQAPTRLDPAPPFRILPGPQADRFPERAWQAFLCSAFTVSPESNRVGLRLTGPALHPVDSADIVSEGIVTGAIQVTGEGQPIVMLPAHATIGGYTKIATVIDEDLDRLGQLRPGDVVRFRADDGCEPSWTLRDMVRLARSVAVRDIGEFAFEDHASGACLRLKRGNNQ